jgi:GMP synthase-like glutamine amidotransferase
MRYLKRYESISKEPKRVSVFDTNEWSKLLPDTLKVVTNTGSWTLNRPSEDNGMGHATNISNLMNCFQISYSQNTPETEDGDVTRDGEPDMLAFDITVVKNNDGKSADPDTLKLNIEITYGDAMVAHFTIEKPNRIKVVHYTGVGTAVDPETFFAFDDSTLEDSSSESDLIRFFNSWGFDIKRDQLCFLDKYPDSYTPAANESIELNPSFSGSTILVVNNSVPQENRHLSSLIKYLDFRGIKHHVASTSEEVERAAADLDIIGAISTGSTGSEIEDAQTRAALSIGCPILGISYGMLALASAEGTKSVDSEERTKGGYRLSSHAAHSLFEGIDMPTMQLNFDFEKHIEKCPSGYSVIAELDGKIAAIADDSEKRYGVMFSPEDAESSYKIIDNFIRICGSDTASDAESLKEPNTRNIIETFSSFTKRNK